MERYDYNTRVCIHSGFRKQNALAWFVVERCRTIRGQVVQVAHNRLLITCRQARQQPGRHWIKRIWLWRCNLVHDLALRHWFEWRQRWNGSASYDWWRYWRSCSCGLTDIADLVSEKLREVDGSLFRRRLLLRWLKHAVDGVPWLMRVAYLVVDQNAVNFCC